ncbi:MAG: DnaA/Hda family protein [Hyphomicrobiales bacterium]|nr:DnaA/Hda family protein [Hyphomicrobiales bacterium]
MSEQLVFELPHRPALGADDFLVSECNATAVRLVDAWPAWSHNIHVIVGPAGCGKSHLANVWRLNSRAQMVANDIPGMDALDSLATAPALVLEDAERAGIEEKTLFHLINLCNENDLPLLMTARILPADWPVSLPDLISRLRSFPVISIGPPDDDLLRAVLVKHFDDRQLSVAPQVISFLTTRMERSMDFAGRLVEAIDKASLEAGRKITRQFASQVLEELISRGAAG